MSDWEGRKPPVSKETKSSTQNIVIPEGTKPVCTVTQLADAQAEVCTLRTERERLLEIVDAAYEALRWASGTDEHWRAEGVLSALVKDYRDKYPTTLSEQEADRE